MRLSLITLAISLAIISPALSYADNSIGDATATNPELASYQSSSLNPAPATQYGAKSKTTQLDNTIINQTVDQTFSNVGDGWAVGGQIGSSAGLINRDINVTRKDTTTFGSQGLTVGAHVDHGVTYANNFYLGEELYASTGNSRTGYKISNNTNTYNTKIGRSVGFDILPGYQISPSSLFYAKLGLSLARLTLNSTYPNGAGDLNSNSPGVDLGVGLRKALTQNLSLALEYDWIAYNAKFNQLSGGYNTTTRFVQSLFSLSLNYQFDNMDPNNTGGRPALAFDSPYAGATLGVKSQVMQNQATSPGLIRTVSVGSESFSERLKLGYGHQFNAWFYLGGEALAEFNNHLSPQQLGISYNQEGDSLGLSLMPGYILNQSNLLFSRVGLIRTKFTGTFNDGDGTNYNSTETGMTLGVGYETALTQFLSLVAEYDYTFYQTIHVFISPTNAITYKPVDQLFSIGLNYRF
ncbi:MAG: outer membrane beta-barrel protein [Gammaproteobacteria bacterium]|nr:outer membrane beta-barrel protein [Gammaproteobacteria bacterium]